MIPAITSSDPLEQSSMPWLDADDVMPVLDVKATTPATSATWSMDDWLARLTADGVVVPGLSAADALLRISTVFACVRVIAEDVAKLPRHLYRSARAMDGTESTTKAIDHPLYEVLTNHPNDWMTGQEMTEYMIGQAALRGVAHARLVRADNSALGRVTEILPMLPGSVERMQDERWGISYRISDYGAGSEIVPPAFMWTINGPMTTPVAGADVGALARQAVDLASSLEASQTRFHRSDARPSGILTTKSNLRPEQREAVRLAWQRAYGQGGEGGIAVLDMDYDFKAMTVSAADSQTIESRAFQIEEICRFFRVHPWAIMRQASSQSYASIEQTGIAHIQQTIQPWVTRLEQTIQRDIIGRNSPLYVKCNINALARGTLLDRVNAYAGASKVYMTPNEIRALEDMDPIADPAMDRVQLQANNTGMAQQPSAAKPSEPVPRPNISTPQP